MGGNDNTLHDGDRVGEGEEVKEDDREEVHEEEERVGEKDGSRRSGGMHFEDIFIVYSEYSTDDVTIMAFSLKIIVKAFSFSR